MNCIRAACEKLSSLDLAGCTLYPNIESCSMCLACGAWAGLPRVVFGAHQADIPGNPYELVNYHAEEHAKQFTKPMQVTGGVLRDECVEHFRGMQDWQRQS